MHNFLFELEEASSSRSVPLTLETSHVTMKLKRELELRVSNTLTLWALETVDLLVALLSYHIQIKYHLLISHTHSLNRMINVEVARPQHFHNITWTYTMKMLCLVTKEDGYSVARLLHWAHTCDWYVVLWGSKRKHHKDTHIKEIGLHFQIWINYSDKVHQWKVAVTHGRSNSSFMHDSIEAGISIYLSITTLNSTQLGGPMHPVKQTHTSNNHNEIRGDPIFNPVFADVHCRFANKTQVLLCKSHDRTWRTWKNKPK